MHKIANVLDAVPSSLQPKVKAALHPIMNAENKEAADLAIDHFEATYVTKYPTGRKARAVGQPASRWPTNCWRQPRRAGAVSMHPHQVALVRAGAIFVDGFTIEREDQRDAA